MDPSNPLLPYLDAASAKPSLILLTSTVSASANWLMFQYMASALTAELGVGKPDAVVVWSCINDPVFWMDGLKPLRINIMRYKYATRFMCIDATNNGGLAGKRLGVNTFPTFKDVFLKTFEELIEKTGKPNARIMCVMDGLDLLLASRASNSHADSVGFILEIIGALKQQASMVIVSAADTPFLRHNREGVPMDMGHTRFITDLAHQASLVISCKPLSTGAAKDVSGELRITKGGGAGNLDEKQQRECVERELLYHVDGNGAVKVFERGAAV